MQRAGDAYAREGLEEIVASEARLRRAVGQSPMGVHVFSPDGASLLTNAAWDELWYLEDGEETSRNVLEDDQVRAAGLVPYVERAIAGERVSTPPLLFDPARTGHEGRARWLKALVYPTRDGRGRIAEVTLLLEDVTDRKDLEDELARRAFRDALTGLPNRALFADRLGHALDRAGRTEEPVAVLFMDIDNFKYVNDSLGHEAGDGLLVEAAGRIKGCLRAEDTVARLGGDEFAVLLEDGAAEHAAEVADKISRSLGAALRLGAREVFPTTSIGVALGGPSIDSPQDLLRRADVAMYAAKAGGKDRTAFYDPAMGRRSRRRLELEADLRGAVERGEIVVRYQPVVSVPAGEIVGFEALARWAHPERGLLSPDEFVPLAEETGLIVPLGRRVLEQACRQASEWRGRHAGGTPPSINVNLSARQLRDPGLVGAVEGALRDAGLHPSGLTLEITESLLVEEAESAREPLRQLKALGVKLAIDDFGTGYSSLSYLGSPPVDTVKLDRSLVAGLERDRSNSTIVLSTISLAHTLDLGVVAEGVETAGEAAKLRALKCDLAQGYHWWKPLDSGEATELLDAQGRPGVPESGRRPGSPGKGLARKGLSPHEQ